MEVLTKRFILRDFVPEDTSRFEAYHADPRFLQFHGAEGAEPGHARKLLELFRAWATERPRINYQLAIVSRKGPEVLLGCCGLRRAGSDRRKAELGIELAPAYWSRYGYAVEVIHALIEFGYGELGLQKIYGRTVNANSRIARLAEAFGATTVASSTPAWMSVKGWRQVEWELTGNQWQGGHPTWLSQRLLRRR